MPYNSIIETYVYINKQLLILRSLNTIYKYLYRYLFNQMDETV